MNPEAVQRGCLLLAVICAVGVVAWWGFALVRFCRADRLTRASMRQALRMRRGWKRLAPMVGLSVTDRTPTFLASLQTKDGQMPKPRVLTPRLRTAADQFGVIVHATCLPKVGLAEYTKAAPYLADAWGAVRVSVLPDGPGKVRMRAVRTDPLTFPTSFRSSGREPEDLTVWDLGVDEYAELVALQMANVPGMTVAGLPGYGKSSLIARLFVMLAPSGAVQFAVADGKVSAADEGDYADIVDRCFAFVGDDLADANALFKRLVELRRRRSSSIKSLLGRANMWHGGPTRTWPLVVLIIDEAHTYFRDYKGSDPQTKKLAALAAENARLVEDLVKKGRSVGMITILATQKATGDAIPTFIRDVCPVGMSFAQKTADAAVAALGEDIRNWPDADPVNLQDPAYVGVASMSIAGRPGFTRVRTPLVDPDHVAQIAHATADLTTDPAQLLADYRAPTLNLAKPLPGAETPPYGLAE
ncbi:cell division protein FtsK [Streptomyces sp. NPDC020917]|uniref:cell division protein FtsK n=1 Tax=Streptomyces sp. NPDC020917 TaxID=3365102 RepID=UPI0037A92379